MLVVRHSPITLAEIDLFSLPETDDSNVSIMRFA